MFEYQFYCSFILVAILDTVVAMPDVVAIVTAKKLTEKGLPHITLKKFHIYYDGVNYAIRVNWWSVC
jgi:hypothetical protein